MQVSQLNLLAPWKDALWTLWVPLACATLGRLPSMVVMEIILIWVACVCGPRRGRLAFDFPGDGSCGCKMNNDLCLLGGRVVAPENMCIWSNINMWISSPLPLSLFSELSRNRQMAAWHHHGRRCCCSWRWFWCWNFCFRCSSNNWLRIAINHTREQSSIVRPNRSTPLILPLFHHHIYIYIYI